MYYPYLRAKQFELIALREFAELYPNNHSFATSSLNNNITPIIEPVKETFNSMKTAIERLSANNIKFALILNPTVGELVKKARSSRRFEIDIVMEELSQDLIEHTNWIPAYNVTNNHLQISESIYKYRFRNTMLICSESTDSANSEFDKLISQDEIKFIILKKENRTLIRKLKSKEKGIIRLDDNFIVQEQNKDYLNIQEERFTEEHLYYTQDGYVGFSDYTALSSKFIEGGSVPRAVVIHLTFRKESNEIWIRHFTSITNSSTSNIQGKFQEAAKKAVDFLDENNIHTNATDELRQYYNSSTYPGLGMIKKISIKHHLELMNNVLKQSL